MNARQMLINVVIVVVLLLIGGGVLYEVYEGNNYVSTTNASVTVPSVTVSALAAGEVTGIPVTIGQSVKAGETILTMGTASSGSGSTPASVPPQTPVRAKAGAGTRGGAGRAGATSTTTAVSASAPSGAVVSPVTGVVTAVSATTGEAVFPGQALLTLTEPQYADIVANIPETAIRNVKDGQSVNVTIDAYPGTLFTGTVAAIQPATQASLSLFPASALSGTFTKVTQLIPVMINIDTQGDRMYNGLSAEVRIQTGNGGL